METYMQVLGVGALSGMRSMAGPVRVSEYLSRHRSDPSISVNWLSSPLVSLAFKVMAAGEMGADKLSFTPSRITALPLAGRFFFGAAAGAALSEAKGGRRITGALLGGASAVTAAFMTYHVRRALTRTLGFPDPLVALAEDALVVTGGRRLFASERENPPSGG